MLSINTNLSSIIAQNSMKISTDKLNQAIERMTTGFKINHAKDNAANYSISTDMTTKIGAYQVAEDNCAQGLDMISTASESLSLIQDKLERLRALATQASNGTYGAQSLKAINAEANALVDEIERQYNMTEYNGIRVFAEPLNTFVMKSATPKIPNYEGIVMTPLTDSVTTITSGTVYSIDNAQQLQHLASLVNIEGVDTTGATFVLISDIDLNGINWIPIGNYGSNSALRFYGTFDGNNHTISNLAIENLSNDVQGLFGCTDNAEIKNLYLDDVDINSPKSYIGTLVGRAMNGSVINNCHVLSSKINRSGHSVGGLLGVCIASDVKNSSTDVELVGGEHTGGLIGAATDGSIIENCFTQGTLTSLTWKCGGLIGSIYSAITIKNCYSIMSITNHARTGGIVGDMGGVNNTLENLFFGGTCSHSDYYGAIGGFAHESTNFMNCYYNISIDSTLPGRGGIGLTTEEIAIGTAFDSFKNVTNDFGENLWTFNADGTPSLNIGYEKISFVPNKGDSSTNFSPDSIFLQIGSDSNNSSRIEFCTKFSLANIDELRSIGYSTMIDFLNIINENILRIEGKQTELGAVQNRLESALDEISIKYENLVSSRSTLRDADIAKVSSTYIQQQILQQASATLMATANQSPAIALQLI